MADNVTTEELELALQELAEGLGLSVKEYVEGGFLDLTTYGTDKAAITARLDALDIIDGSDGIETLAEKVASLNALLSEDGDLATDILNRIATNTTAIGSVQTQLDGYVASNDSVQATQDANIAGLQTSASDLAGVVSANKTASEAADTLLADRLTDTEADIAIIDSDVTVVGSTDYKVEQEKLRAVAAEAANRSVSDASIATAKQEAIDTAGIVSAAGDAALQTQIDNLGTASGVTDSVVAALQSEVDASQAALGLETDGSFVSEDGSDTLYDYIKDELGDADTLKKQVRKLAKKAKEADQALASDISTNAAGIASEVATRTAEVGTLTSDLAAEVATRASEIATVTAATVVNANGLVQEIADRQAGDADLQGQIDALGGTGSGSLGDLEGRMDVAENAINDTVDGNGDLVKGVVTKVADNASAIAAESAARIAELTQTVTDMRAYSDARDLKASSMDICSVGNRFRNALGLGDSTCDGSGDGEAL